MKLRIGYVSNSSSSSFVISDIDPELLKKKLRKLRKDKLNKLNDICEIENKIEKIS